MRFSLSLRSHSSELTEIHDVVPTDSAVIHHNVPGPQRHSIPLEGGGIRITNKHYLTDTLTAGLLTDTGEKGNDRLLNQSLTSAFHFLG